MNETLLIGLLVGATALLLGLLVLLIAAGGVILLLNRRLEQERRESRRARRRRPEAMPVRSRPSPTPISRSVAPPPPARSPLIGEDDATEVMGAHHLRAFRDESTDTGTTEVEPVSLPGELALDESEETTAVGPSADPASRPTES